ncbi:MAG: ferritin-like domain-containing protein [Terrimicrobiaceae bacterium]|nr:ferritin-like domain-containing protein [Terrimicrobiaceae bacterium]
MNSIDIDSKEQESPHLMSSPLGRRSFVKGLGLAGVALLPAGGLVLSAGEALAGDRSRRITQGDVAILKFLAAAELLETDLWQQYLELAAGNKPFRDALEVLDEDMGEYIEGNTNDEISHAAFINGFLESVGEQPVNLDAFRTLPSSPAHGAVQRGRLTNLGKLTVDTSWYRRYRSAGNPDFGDHFAQAVRIVDRPAIPLHDGNSSMQIQAIANTAAFHFGTIEQGGSSLYASLAVRATNLDVLRILLSIGGTEVFHFAIWDDLAGNAPPLNTGDGLVFPNLNADPGTQTAKVMPRPCKFLNANLPHCSVIRPIKPGNAGAVAAASGLTRSGLFSGQSQQFFQTLNALAVAADSAHRR